MASEPTTDDGLWRIPIPAVPVRCTSTWTKERANQAAGTRSVPCGCWTGRARRSDERSQRIRDRAQVANRASIAQLLAIRGEARPELWGKERRPLWVVAVSGDVNCAFCVIPGQSRFTPPSSRSTHTRARGWGLADGANFQMN